eukprot:5408939-Pleurochrysis_carterae.AAC.1
MVCHPRPQRRARGVGAVGQVRRKAGQPIVIRDVPGPPPRHGVDPFRRAPATKARRVRHGEGAAWRCCEHRRVPTSPDLLQQGCRHVAPEHVV